MLIDFCSFLILCEDISNYISHCGTLAEVGSYSLMTAAENIYVCVNKQSVISLLSTARKLTAPIRPHFKETPFNSL